MGPRALNALLGLWLFLSTFLWGQTPAQRWNGWVVGLLAVTDALAGISGEKRGRLLNAALGGWLILSAILMHHVQQSLFWNELIVGFAMAFLALAATAGDLRRHRPADV